MQSPKSSPVASNDIKFAMKATSSIIQTVFYLSGAVIFIGIAIIAIKFWNALPSVLSETPPFVIEADALKRLRPHHRAARMDGARLDVLQYGQLYDRGTDLTLMIVQPPVSDQGLTRDFFAEIRELEPIARRARLDSSRFWDLQTRQGPVRAAEFMIRADGRDKLCLAFLSRFDQTALYYKGWFCEGSGARPNTHELACLLDRLRATAPLATREAEAALKIEPARRCGAEPVSQTSDTRPFAPRTRYNYR